MMGEFLKGVNVKRMMMAMGAVFVTFWVTSFLIHGLWLESQYKATANLWRTETEMHSFFIWMILAQLIFAKYFTYIFARGYEGKGVAEGIRFGLVMGAFNASNCLIQYVVSPLPGSLVVCWVAGGIAQAVACGVVASMVYKK